MILKHKISRIFRDASRVLELKCALGEAWEAVRYMEGPRSVMIMKHLHEISLLLGRTLDCEKIESIEVEGEMVD